MRGPAAAPRLLRPAARERGEGSRPDLHWGVLLHRRRRPPRQVQLASMAGAADCSCPIRHRRKEQEGSRAVDRTQPCAGKSRRRRPLRAMTGGRREAPAALRSVLSTKGKGRGHVRAAPLLTGAGERGGGPWRRGTLSAASGRRQLGLELREVQEGERKEKNDIRVWGGVAAGCLPWQDPWRAVGFDPTARGCSSCCWANRRCWAGWAARARVWAARGSAARAHGRRADFADSGRARAGAGPPSCALDWAACLHSKA